MRPNALMQASTIAMTEALSVTSHSRGCDFSAILPGLLGSATVSSMVFGALSAAKTLAPSSTKRTAVARPLPQPGPTQPAPVISATLP